MSEAVDIAVFIFILFSELTDKTDPGVLLIIVSVRKAFTSRNEWHIRINWKKKLQNLLGLKP